MPMQAITILGATGSIGASTLDVIRRHPDRYRVHALTGHQRLVELAQLAREFRPARIVVPHEAARIAFLQQWDLLGAGGPAPEVLCGPSGLDAVATDAEVNTVMAAIVGAAGLQSTLAAARAGKRILLANKESLVVAGMLLIEAVQRHGAVLLPVDSEHNAIFQCLAGCMDEQGRANVATVRRLLLTASGGPFLERPLETLGGVTPEQACAHPNWQMGRKISVDSATMMNKGLEVIEAHWLFGLPADRIDVLIHPSSVVHSMVEYVDGSVLAQLGLPDMRTPIAHVLAHPERIDSGVGSLDLTRLAALRFLPPDLERFPCLRLAYQALRQGQAAMVVLNAANEVAVDAFLCRQLGYLGIPQVVQRILDALAHVAVPNDLGGLLSLDEQARRLAQACVRELSIA